VRIEFGLLTKMEFMILLILSKFIQGKIRFCLLQVNNFILQISHLQGSAIDPFWAMYAQHATAEVANILEEYRIGNLAKV
jgi:hypothetical protein